MAVAWLGVCSLMVQVALASATGRPSAACSFNGEPLPRFDGARHRGCRCHPPWEGTRCNRLSTGWRAETLVPGTVVADCPDLTDCTEGLSAALRSGPGRVVVPRHADGGVVWPVRGVSFASDQVVLLEEGVIIGAKRNASYIYGCSPPQSLAAMNNVRNLTLLAHGASFVMERAAYANLSLCEHSEFRMALSLRASDGVALHGLTAAESGGDGMYIDGCGRDGCRSFSSNIHIEDCSFERNYRQGLSVISVENLTVINSSFSHTGVPYGTAPMGGVDIEPDSNVQRIVNVQFDGCRSIGNRGAQYQFYGAEFNGNTRNVSVAFVNCVADGDATRGRRPPVDPRNASIPWASPGWFFGNFENDMRGEILLKGCATRNVWDWGVHMRYIQPQHVAIRITNSSFQQCARRRTLRQTESIVGPANDSWPTAPIAILGAELYLPSGGLLLESVFVEDDVQRPWLDLSAAAPGAATGTAMVRNTEGCSIRGHASSLRTECEEVVVA